MAAAAYAVVDNSTIVNLIVWDGVSAYAPPNGATLKTLSSLPSGIQIGWTLSGGVWSAPAPAPVDLTATITFLQFMALFTAAEQAAIIGAADIQTKVFVMSAAGSGGLQLVNPEVVAGVGYLASTNLITAPRAAAALAGSPP